ncbi:MAG: PhzF family phenazine biosynthesis protein [Thermoleophilaceae bacterium]
MDLHVLRVFADDEGRFGNPLGVVRDGPAVPPGERQRLAAELGYSETVFVDDAERGEIRIFTPAAEIPFAGHPTVGTAWLLGVDVLRVPAGEVRVRRSGDLTWVAARPEWAPEFGLVQLGSAAEVEALTAPPAGVHDPAAWAFEDEERALVRSRVFPLSWGIEEDEATGAAAVRLGALLGRPLTIRQGRGSVLHVRPGDDGFVEVGGRVVMDERRELR